MTEEKNKASAALAKAKATIEAIPEVISITTAEQFEAAAVEVKKIKAYKKAVKEYWDPLCENGHKTWKALTGRRKEFLDPADAKEQAYKLGMSRYSEAERKRAAEELKKRQEAEREAAEKKRLAQVEEMQDMGEIEQADHLASQPLDVTPVAAPKETKVDGVSVSYRYSAEVVDLPAFLAFCIKEPRFLYLVKDFPMKELNKLAVAQKEMFDFPGVELKKKPITSVRG
jgi:type I site-specific restriction-modification system R (restriction) subunit